MGIMLKLLALITLAVSYLAPAYAGMCNKSHPNWDAVTKKCPEKPVVLKERAPTPSPAPEPERKKTEVIIPPPVVLKVLDPPRSELVLTSRSRSVIPGRSMYVEGLAVSTCNSFVQVPGVGWSTRPAIVESSSYELRTIPARGTTNNLLEE